MIWALSVVTRLLKTKQRVPSTRFLCSVKASEVIILDSVEAEDVTGDMAPDIMLCRFISSVFDIHALGEDLQRKNKKINQ